MYQLLFNKFCFLFLDQPTLFLATSSCKKNSLHCTFMQRVLQIMPHTVKKQTANVNIQQKFGLHFCQKHRLKAPAKRSQRANATYHNIVLCNMLCAFGSNLTISQLEPKIPNMLQHIATLLECCDRLSINLRYMYMCAVNSIRTTVFCLSSCFT